MADEKKDKKYYWLRLERNFFKRHDIRIIENMENGKEYVLFYMKLLLESIDHEGNLRFNDLIPYNDSMLATITNTNVDIVRSAIKLFENLDMLEILDDQTIFITDTQKMLGEAKSSSRVKKFREKQKQLAIETVGNVTETLHETELELEKEIEIELYKDIILYLNEKCGSKFKYSSKATQRHINGRLAEGFTLQHFKTVIDKKSAEWKDDSKMVQYLRPETLFGTKFEGYLNQKVVEEVKSKPNTNSKIHNFQERDYSKEDYESMEQKLWRKQNEDK